MTIKCAFVGNTLPAKYRLSEAVKDVEFSFIAERDIRPVNLVENDCLLIVEDAHLIKAIRSSPISSVAKIPIIAIGGDVLTSLNYGADTHIKADFDTQVLIAHIYALTRRVMLEAKRELLSIGELMLEISTHTLTFNGKAIRLSSKEENFLLSLNDSNPLALTIDQAIELETGSSAQAIRNLVCKLRDKLDRLAMGLGEKTIVSVKNGYRLG